MPSAEQEAASLFLKGRVTLDGGDCLAVLKRIESNSISATVCDPPYELGFMGKSWDSTGIANSVELWLEVLRVMKPGAHLLAFGGTRTYHRMACAIEDAGFEVRDMTAWLYGSGFPKSTNVPLAIDKKAGAVKSRSKAFNMKGRGDRAEELNEDGREFLPAYKPITTAAKEWNGWGTALKPGLEPACLARKPLSEDTVAANVLRWGTGAINIDGCRVGGREARELNRNASIGFGGSKAQGIVIDGGQGRWPANVVHDGSDEVVVAFPSTGPSKAAARGGKNPNPMDWGSAARFFYSSKAGKVDRDGSGHPTVKPVDVMRWLVRLITPPLGIVLDPFAGTGTTGEAAFLEGFRVIMIERDLIYQQDIRRRMARLAKGKS